MIVTLIVTVHLLGLAALWGARRHIRAAAWDRELEAAFEVAEQRDLPMRRVL